VVLIDTSAWIDFFHDKALTSVVGREVDRLLDEGRAVTTGMVLGEVLQGAADDGDLGELQDYIDAVEFLESTEAMWRLAAAWSYDLRRKGMTTPLSDLIIAATALSAGHSVFATDPHFQRVPGLELHKVRP
jgi:predicted nucleic acid-binding protein